MKLVKMSLAAALLMGASAYAIDNVKISGDAQVFYSTQDADYLGYDAVTDQDASLFDKDSSAADAALHLKVTADLTDGISAGASYTAISTLGLENNFVSNVWAGSHTVSDTFASSYAGGTKVDNASWFNEAWIAATLGKTTAKIGRMELDTPLAYTETWSIERNSFEAAVLLNQDLPDTTLVAAYVGNGNGNGMFYKPSFVTLAGLAIGSVVSENGDFSTYGTDGAYAFGIVNNSIKPLTLQGWYYDVTKLAQAYWLQADLAMDNGILAGAQYSGISYDDKSAGLDPLLPDTDSSVYALMLGFAMKDVATLRVAYSSVEEDAAAGYNTATMDGASKLYTEAWWNYGYVVAADASTIHVDLTGSVVGIDLGAYYTNVDNGTDDSGDLSEFTFTAGKSFGPLDATLAYINTDAGTGGVNDGDAYNMIQAYLTLNF